MSKSSESFWVDDGTDTSLKTGEVTKAKSSSNVGDSLQDNQELPVRTVYALGLEGIKRARYVLPLVGDKAHDLKQHPLEPWQLSGWSKTICTTSNVYGYYTSSNPLVQQLYLCNLIHSHDLLSYEGMVIRYEPLCEGYISLSPIEIYDLMKESFHNKKKNALLSKHLCFNLNHPKIHNAVDYYNRSWWSLNPSIPYLRSTFHMTDPKVVDHLFNEKRFYQNLKPVRNQGTYSIIHQFFNNTDLILFNFSHRLLKSEDGKLPVIHQATRIRLRLEANCIHSFFVLFNSSLVHSGAETMYSNPTEYSGSNNPRLFAYVSRDGGQHNKTVNDNGTVDYGSFLFCGGLDCAICQKAMKKGKIGTNDFVINAFDECVRIETAKQKDISKDQGKKKRRAKSTSHGSRYLLFGDLERLGWAVYKGVRLTASQDRDTLFVQNDLKSIIAKSKSTSTHSWKSIEPGRKSYSIVSDSNVISGRNKNDVMIADIIRMHDRLEHRVREIAGFKSCKLYDSSVIINDGHCFVQHAHRDIGGSEIPTSTKTNNTKKNEIVPEVQVKKRKRSSSRLKTKPDRLVFHEM